MDSSGTLFLIFLLLLQLILVVALVLGGMYLLWCFGRAATSLDRLADVAELWLERQNSVMSAETPSTPMPPIPANQAPVDPPTEQPANQPASLLEVSA